MPLLNCMECDLIVDYSRQVVLSFEIPQMVIQNIKQKYAMKEIQLGSDETW